MAKDTSSCKKKPQDLFKIPSQIKNVTYEELFVVCRKVSMDKICFHLSIVT